MFRNCELQGKREAVLQWKWKRKKGICVGYTAFCNGTEYEGASGGNYRRSVLWFNAEVVYTITEQVCTAAQFMVEDGDLTEQSWRGMVYDMWPAFVVPSTGDTNYTPTKAIKHTTHVLGCDGLTWKLTKDSYELTEVIISPMTEKQLKTFNKKLDQWYARHH